MKHVISSERIPIKIWADGVEEGVINQAKNLANLPFAFKHIALMPDAHTGYGMPIGGVLATKNVIIPNAVGVDIGCGMCAYQLPITDIDIEILKRIIEKIRQRIPTGCSHHKEPQDSSLMPKINLNSLNGFYEVVSEEYDSALKQIGTLGSGNHFLEIQKGSDRHIWIMLHSGSRNIGYKVARHYNNIAKSINEKWHSSVPLSWDLAFLPLDSWEGACYRAEMGYCVEFAYCNRKLMMERAIECFKEIIPEEEVGKYPLTNEMINIAHNYALLENHFGINVVVHRKGATLARKDTIGIIPGSQGSKSYITTGNGNPESFYSCSHGAGRRMSRTKAREELTLENEQKRLNDLGILHSLRNQKDLDEAPSAYKDISTVMENQKDLVTSKIELTPLAVIKG